MKLSGEGLGHTVAGNDGHERWLFRDLDLAIAPGRPTAIVGPNGAGKTTLLRVLAGLARPTRGRVSIDERSIDRIDLRPRARAVAYLPQTTPLYHDVTVRELVMLGRAAHLGRFGPPSHSDDAAVVDALRRVGIGHIAARGVFSLSGGEYQRVMLARMLATQASILVLDEPTTALDIGHALDFLELLQSLADDGRTVVLAMHDLELARRYAAQIVCLTGSSDGRFRIGSPQVVLTPSVLEPVFGVRVRSTADGLVFSPG